MSIFKIDVSEDFFEVFVKAFHQRHDLKSSNISEYMIILPSQQAVNFMKMEFLKNSSILLPSIYSIGNISPEEIITYLAREKQFDEIAKFKPVAGLAEQKLFVKQYLAKTDENLIQSDRHLNIFVNQLVSSINEIKKNDISYDRLINFDLIDMPIHLEKAYHILIEAYLAWEKYLAKINKYDEIGFRNFLLKTLTNYLSQYKPSKMITIAGSTGSIDISSELIYRASKNVRCDVVLYGLDTALMQDNLQENHPQYLLSKLCKKLKIKASQIKAYSKTEAQAPNKFISEIFSSSEQISRWNNLGKISPPNLEIIEADDELEEKYIIRDIIKNNLSINPEAKILIISNSENFAKNLLSILRTDKIYPQHSYQDSLLKTNIFTFLTLVYEVIIQKTDDMAKILALMKHEFTANIDFIGKLEVKILRGHKIGNIWRVIRHIKHCGYENEADKLGELIGEEPDNNYANFKAQLLGHINIAERISQSKIWEGPLGNYFSSVIYNFLNYKLSTSRDNNYMMLFTNLLSDYNFDSQILFSPNIYLLDSVGARLYRADIVIISGFNETSWPKASGNNFPICRPIQNKLGLPSDDLRVGQQAFDLYCHTHSPQVFITRSKRDGEALLEQSRWLSRIRLLARKVGCVESLFNNNYLAWFKNKFVVNQRLSYAVPAPNPAIDKRPTRYSATDLEKLMHDPYYIYCSKILKLKQLDPVNKIFGAMDYGNLVHDIFEMITLDQNFDFKSYVEQRVSDPLYAKLWLPRINRAVQWLRDYNQKFLENEDSEIVSEYKNILNYKISGQDIEIVCKSDRIEIAGNYVSVIDYKTGSVPSNSEANKFFAMQLQIGALGFLEDNKNICGLKYFAIKAGEEIVEIHDISPKEHSLNDFVIDTRQHIIKLLEYYLAPNPFPAQTDKKLQLSYNPYAHLSRIYTP